MASRLIYPHSMYTQSTGRVFEHVHLGDGGQLSPYDVGIGVEDSLAGDGLVHLRFDIPDPLPSGTLKLRLRALADATSGAAKVNPKWASVADGEDPSAATMNAEGDQTITWAAAEDDIYKTTDVTLDADTPVAGEVLCMNLHFESTSWTLAVISVWQVAIFWE